MAIDILDFGGTGASIGALSLRKSLGAIVTEVSLFFASETLACPHEFCPFVHVDFPGSGASWSCIHCVWISVRGFSPSCFPLFECLRLFVHF